MYKNGKYYQPKNLGSAGTDPTTQGNNGNAWKRVNRDGTDYLQTGQSNATPYDANTTYNDPVPPTGQNYHVTHNGKLWKANATGGQFSGTEPGSSGSGSSWTVVSGGSVTIRDGLGNTLGTISGNAGNRVLTIPSGTTIIRDNAFKDKNLKSVTIPNGVTAIGKGAFEGNTGLSSVTIPNSVTHIKENAFKNTDLSSVTIPNSVTSIGNGAFRGVELNSVTLPSSGSLTRIENNAFRDTELTSVTIPTSVTSIGTGAFQGTDLASVTFVTPSSVTSIENDAFRDITTLYSVRIPTSVTSIGTGAFAGTALTQVRISQSLLSAAPTSAFPTPTPPATITFRDHSGNVITP